MRDHFRASETQASMSLYLSHKGGKRLAQILLLLGLSVPAGLASTVTITTLAEPAAGGTVTGGGIYNRGTRITVTATPAKGYYFQKFTGYLHGVPNPQVLFTNNDA